jgi:lipoyl-dependent peroxiredoxin
MAAIGMRQPRRRFFGPRRARRLARQRDRSEKWPVVGAPYGGQSARGSVAAALIDMLAMLVFAAMKIDPTLCQTPLRATEGSREEPTMTKLEKVLYTAKAHTTGGRDGASRSDDGRLEVKLSSPGAPGTGTNPEQLFAAGWSACFLSAMRLVAGKMKVTLPADMAIDAEVDLGTTHGAYGLAARLNVRLPGMEHHAAQALADAAHQVCPYSLATRGNIEVVINVV